MAYVTSSGLWWPQWSHWPPLCWIFGQKTNIWNSVIFWSVWNSATWKIFIAFKTFEMLANISCYAPSILAEIFFARPRTFFGHCCGRVQSTDMKASRGEKVLWMEKRENAALLSKQETSLLPRIEASRPRGGGRENWETEKRLQKR